MLRNSLVKKVFSALKYYDMVQNGDCIAVCVSGGKDSLALLWILSEMRRCLAQFNIKVVSLDMCFGDKYGDFSGIKSFCSDIGVECRVLRSRLWELIFVRRKEKNPCSLCSRMRKGMLVDLAINLGCNKIAFGHHRDDAVETLLMNLFYNGFPKCFSPVTYLSRRNIRLIRPLVFCKETDILKFAKSMKLPVVKSECSADGVTARQRVKDFLNEVEGRFSSNIRENLFKTLLRTKLSGW